MKRSSTWLLASRALQAVKGAWVVYVALIGALVLVSGIWRTAIIVFLVYYTWTRIYFVFYEWVATKYSMHSTHLRLRRGLFVRSYSQVKWSDVRSVSTTADLILRAGHCTRVVVSPLGTSGNPFVLGAVPLSEAQNIHHHVSEHITEATRDVETTVRTSVATIGNTPVRVQELERVSPLLTVWDYVLIGFTYGKFIFFIPIALSAFRMIFGHTDNQNILAEASIFAGLGTPVQLLVITLVLIIGLIYGTVLAWIKYAGLAVGRNSRGYNYVAGLLSREVRQVPARNIDLVIFQQNLLMRLFGRYQVRVVTGGSDGTSFRGVLFPLVRRQNANHFLSDILGPETKKSEIRIAGRSGRFTLVGIVLVTLATMVWLAWPHLPLVVNFWVTFGAVILSLLIINKAADGIAVKYSAGSPHLTIRKGMMWSKTYFFRSSGVHSFRSRLPTSRRWHRPASLRIWYRSQMNHSIGIGLLEKADLEKLITAMEDASTKLTYANVGCNSTVEVCQVLQATGYKTVDETRSSRGLGN